MNESLAHAVVAARAAGKEALHFYGSDFATRTKADTSPVTEADLAAHRRIVSTLSVTGIPVLSEEGDHASVGYLKHARVWVVDPLDGTKDFIQKTNEWSIQIALVEEGRPVVGVVYLPVGDILYTAVRGEGAYRETGGKRSRLTVSGTLDPHEARLVASRNHFSEENSTLKDSLGLKEIVRVGSNGVKFGRIAEGAAEIFFSTSTTFGWWDIAAPELVLLEAGGKVTGVHGEEIHYQGPGIENPHGVVATNAQLHEAVLEVVQSDIVRDIHT